ncbi:MAG: hypothetical protein ACTSRU_12940 [Candidatus Hodarchaeales archaeon]
MRLTINVKKKVGRLAACVIKTHVQNVRMKYLMCGMVKIIVWHVLKNLRNIGVDKMEIISLEDVDDESIKLLLKELGYSTDGEYVYKDEEKVKDKYLDKEIKFDNMAILPGESGATILIDDNLLSIAYYMDEFGDIEEEEDEV